MMDIGVVTGYVGNCIKSIVGPGVSRILLVGICIDNSVAPYDKKLPTGCK